MERDTEQRPANLAWQNIETAEVEFLRNLADKGGLSGDAPMMLRHCAKLLTARPAPGQMEEQAEAWRAVFRTLSEVSPGWMFHEDGEHRRGHELACDTIRRLAARNNV